MRRELIFISTILIIGGLLVVGFGCPQDEMTNEVVEVTPAPTTTALPITGTVTPGPSTTTTKETVELNNQVYINEHFGYKITLPNGYISKEGDNRTNTLSRFDQDKVVITDSSGVEFAHISTPALEIGAAGYDEISSQEISVPGSDVVLEWKKLISAREGDDNGLIWITWGDFQNNYLETGLITHSFEGADDLSIAEFEKMVRTLRFI